MLLLVSVPSAAVAVFAWGLIHQVNIEKAQTTRFERLSEMALHASDLVHELQKERGASAGFIASEGKAFSTILKEQRRSTDNQVKLFSAYRKTFDQDAFDSAFAKNFSEATTMISGLNGMRSRVSAQSVGVSDAVSYYTNLNSRLLGINDNLARYSPTGSTANSAAAFSTFLQSKERAGIERAVMSSVFAKDAFTPASLSRFSDLVNTQNIYLAVFRNMASEAEKDYFNAQMNHKSVKDVERMRAVAFNNSSTGGFGVDSEVWFSTITQKINLLKNVEDHLGDALYENAKTKQEAAVASFWQTISILAICVLLSLLLVFFVARSVDTSISKAAELAKAIASGNLTTQHTSKNRDEAGQLLNTLNRMQDELIRVIGASTTVSESVSAGANQISESSSTLRQRTDDQASNLEQTASSTEEISSTIKRNAEFATEARSLAESASVEAEHGGEVVSRAVQAMSEINVASKKIASITGVIDEIAFQTNLLALNAAVEAARAGEQGRGFAVVASEVRSLAGRSAEAAKEIKELIGDSVEKVESGAQFVDQSGSALEKIVKSVKKVNEIISDIATASQEQSLGVDIINQSMVQMNKITRDNTDIAKDATSAGRNMAEQAAALSDNLSFFHFDKHS